jgi:cell division protein FtsB
MDQLQPPSPTAPSDKVGQPASSSPRQRRLPLSNLQIILIALIIIGGRLAIDFSKRIIEGQDKVDEQRALEAEIAALEAERRQLEASKAYYSSPGFVEAWAHDEGKMVRDGERLVVPVYEDIPEAPPEQRVSAPAAEPAIPVWQVWWTLFFDTTPPPIDLSGF